MNIDELLSKIQGKFGQDILNLYKKNDKRAYIDIYPKDIVAMTRYLFKDLGLRFNIASAVDDFDGLEVLYHFSLDRAGVVVSVRVILKDKLNPSIDTITKVTRSAWWIEREMHELFGINFNDNEDLRPLLLSDDWPKGVYPMRKDFIAQKRDSRKA
ncbi:MAG TPA: NADH-quinone oxidoreductase subunit C [Candidatus Omnitrophota bacterium]|nr:NADH-quinone oxidoreductase subunit C [Candidatus Omnitrophota bacterium]